MPGNSRECVNLHIGQAGCQVGLRTWELFCKEHCITPEGERTCNAPEDAEGVSSFFVETPHGQYVPRSVFLDTDPSTRDFVLSQYPRLFHPEDVLGYKQDCKCNFFEGRFVASAFKVKEEVSERMRKAVDLCDNLQGFFIYHSVGGGTGSGVAVEVLHDLHDQYAKKVIVQPLIYPSSNFSSSIVEPYNCIFATHYMRDYIDLSMMLDNQAAYRMCQKNLGLANPDFSDVNRMIAQVVSACTTSMRYKSALNASLTEIVTNLVPEKNFRYAIVSLSPVRNVARSQHEQFTAAEILTDLFEARNFLCDCGEHVKHNRYLSAVILLRGKENASGSTAKDASTMRSTSAPAEVPIEANSAVQFAQSLCRPTISGRTPVRFVPWMDSGFKIGVVGVPPSVPDNWCMAQPARQGALLGNTTAVRQLFVRQYTKFLKLFFNKAYVWQFIEANGEIDAFTEAREGVRQIIDCYEDLLKKCVEVENQKQGTAVVRVEGATSA